jgi:hypothetical protein
MLLHRFSQRGCTYVDGASDVFAWSNGLRERESVRLVLAGSQYVVNGERAA